MEPIQRATIDDHPADGFVSLRKALGVTAFGINQITLRPGQRLRIHRHRLQEEIYFVLHGTLSLTIEGNDELELHERELARVPAHVRRQLSNRSKEACTLIAIGAAGEHNGRDGEAFRDWNEAEGRPPQDVPLPDDLTVS